MSRLQKHLACALVVWGVVVLLNPAAQADAPANEGQFVPLFNGTDLEGWDGDPRFWRVENGALVGETAKDNTAENNTFLIHRGGQFDNFELRLSYKVAGFNSGVQYRSVDQGNWVVAGYQCDFEARWHKPKGQPNAEPIDKFSGMFFDEKGRHFLARRGEVVIIRANSEKPNKTQIEKLGSVGDPIELESHIKRNDWNELVVIANGNQFTHIINGHIMAIGFDEDEARRTSAGLFAFQLHSGPPMRIDVKDVRIRVIQ